MSAFCLVREQADNFIKGLRSGEIDPLKLAKLSSEERNAYLSKFVGEENAKQVNSLFESKLLLKNQKQGMISWAKKVGGLTPEAKRDLITKIGKMDNILNPQDETGFLKDLASTKLGADVTATEAKSIFELSNKVKEEATNMQEDSTFKTESQRLAYGRAKVELANYVNDLKGNNKFSISSLKDVGGLSKSIRASLDDSAIFRQGWKTLFTHPATWTKNALKTFSDAVKTVGGKEVMNEIMADRESRPNELNGNYKKMGLAVSKTEDAFPSTLPEKIPIAGRIYKASETAYTGFVYRQRMDIADKYLQIAKDQNVDLTDKQLKSIGSMVNSLTGRGNFGKYEPAAGLLNNVFFSSRNIKAQFDTLGHVVTGAGGSNFVRKEAAINLIKVVSGIAAIMTIANAVKPGSAETDPKSSDFGKIKIGNTRFDISGGMSSLVTLATRIATQSSKSSITGEVTPLNSGKFGAKTGKDVVTDYLTNKLSPVGQVIVELINQKDFNNQPLTVEGEIKNLIEPLGIANYEELAKDPNSANKVVAMIADGLGIATNTYSQAPKPDKTWSADPTIEQKAFQAKVGNEKFNKANTDFNDQYNGWLKQVSNNPSYTNMNKKQQQSVQQAKRDDLQTKIFKSYGFNYKAAPVNKFKQQQQKNTVKKLIK